MAEGMKLLTHISAKQGDGIGCQGWPSNLKAHPPASPLIPTRFYPLSVSQPPQIPPAAGGQMFKYMSLGKGISHSDHNKRK